MYLIITACMDIPTDSELLAQIDAFIEATPGMTPTRFGLDATGEGGLVKSIREGRSLTLRHVHKIVAFMKNYVAGETPSPEIDGDKFPSAKVA